MLQDLKSSGIKIPTTPVDGAAVPQLNGLRPWEDTTLAPEDRLKTFTGLVREKLEAIRIAFDRAADAGDTETQKAIMNSPITKKWMDEGTWLTTASAEAFSKRIDCVEIRSLLGKNFLGAEAWRTQGIDVGAVPIMPLPITESLIESECPLHPGRKIKDTHLLVLVPETVNGEPYTALKLHDLCAVRKGSVEKLINQQYVWYTSWELRGWAVTPKVKSEWMLIPKSDPDYETVPAAKQFRFKTIAEQEEVLVNHYPEYREAKTIELMTAVLLYDLVNKEQVLPHYLRCLERNLSGGRVCVGYFDADGLRIADSDNGYQYSDIGRALVRKL